MFRSMRKIYIEEEMRHWIFTIRIAMYGIFIPLFEHPPMCMRDGATLEGCQEPSCLEHYFEKAKEWHKSYKNVKEVKKKKSSNSLKKVRVKTLMEQRAIYVKDVVEAYVKRMEKDLRLKIFKHHLYIQNI